MPRGGDSGIQMPSVNERTGMKKLNDVEIVAGIRSGDDSVKSAMYLQYRDEFVRWALGNMKVTDTAEALTLYTDACVAAWDKISSGGYVLRPGVTFKTYLFQIAKYMVFNAGRKRKFPMEEMDKYETAARKNDSPEYQTPDIFLTGTADELDMEHKKRMIVKDVIFNHTAEPCRSIFRYIYYEKMSCSMVADRMSYSGPDTVKTISSRCRGKLRTVLTERFRKSDLI